MRVVVLDGLSRADAKLPSLDALCTRGTDLAIDVGFPTKSLPVQAVLWTGLTAQQLGLGPHNGPRVLRDPLPARVRGSIAVVESWTVIARSMGFAEVRPDVAADRARDDHDATTAARWRTRFPDEAVAVAASDTRLAMIHVLAIDEAAHAHGRGGAAYRAAIDDADRLLARVIAARPDATWFVLSDHGHLARGGHGDAEDEVRIVRGCVAGAGIAPRHGSVALVDVARTLHDTLGLAPPVGARGRSLAAAIAAGPGPTVPPTPGYRLLGALLVLVVGAAVGVKRVRPRWALVWPVVAAGLYVALEGVPSLSFRESRVAAVCAAMCVIPLVAIVRDHRARVTVLLVPAAAMVAAAVVLAGVPEAIVDGRPPAVPRWTAVLEVVAAGMAVALAVAAGLLAWSATPDMRRPRRGRVP